MRNTEADLLARVAGLIDRLETLLPAPAAAPDWKAAIAYRWRNQNGRGFLKPVAHPHRIRLADLRGVDEQKQIIEAQHAPIRRGPTREQCAALRRARHGQILFGQSGAESICFQRPASD